MKTQKRVALIVLILAIIVVGGLFVMRYVNRENSVSTDAPKTLFSIDEVYSVELQNGTTGAVAIITDNKEIDLWKNKLNSFRYTSEQAAELTVGWYYSIQIHENSSDKPDRIYLGKSFIKMNDVIYTSEVNEYFSEQWLSQFFK